MNNLVFCVDDESKKKNL